jgi:hypothetical protein
MTTTRRYYFEHSGVMEEGHQTVLAVLQHACEAHWWYNEPTVEGQPFSRLSFAFNVSARDQWWVHRRAMKLAVDCYRALTLGARHVPEPMWETLPPHMNRGRHRSG